MKIKVGVSVLVLILLGSRIFAELGWGESLKLKEVEVYTGLATSRFYKEDYFAGFDKHPEEYSLVPMGCQFGFGLEKWSRSEFLLELVVGPFLNSSIKPKNAMEVGSDLLLKIGYRGWDKMMPYLKVGTGFIYTSHRFEGQGTKLDFLVQSGLGVAYFLNKAKNSSVNLEYRFRHFSNGDLIQPNEGVTLGEILIGFSRYF